MLRRIPAMRAAPFVLALIGPAAALLAAPAASAADRDALAACQVVLSADPAVRDPATLQTLAQQVSSLAAASQDPAMRHSATVLSQAAQPGVPPRRIETALRTFRDRCQKAGTTTTKSADVPEAEFDRQLQRVLKRAGTADATCDKKQFGGGWTAVCR